MLYDGVESLLFVADTGNHRIIVLNEKTLECVDVIGKGRAGFEDGDFASATFNQPQGMCYVRRGASHVLYVCDVKNHSVREVNLGKRSISTIAGTGARGGDRRGGRVELREQPLASPWDIVAVNENFMLIAMAGSHQIWAYDVEKVILVSL